MGDRITAKRPFALGAVLGSLAIAAALAWFTVPILAATYNEGFQATIVLNADAIRHGWLGGVDPLHGLNNDFMLMSRFGVSLLLAGLMQLGLPAVIAFRLVMLVSLTGLVAANAALLTWRYRIGPLLACLPMLLFPGLFESAWFFNDNVLSAALSSGAVLLLWRGRSWPATVGAAALWGCAVACRTDAVLVAPAFAIIGLARFPRWSARIGHAALAAPIAILVPVLIYRAFGLNLLDILPLTRQATALWARSDTWVQVAEQVVKGFAPPGLLLLVIGAVAAPLRRRWLEAGLCVPVPALYAAAYGRMLTEVRYLLPLSPFFGLAMAEGWSAIGLAGLARRRLACGALAILALPCILPPRSGMPFFAADHDMPRAGIGRLWSPVLGAWWNGMLAAGAGVMRDTLLTSLEPGGTLVVVSADWTPDRMVDLILRSGGFALDQGGLPAACRRGAERFVRGGSTVVHVRTHLPMIPTERSGVNWEIWGAPCTTALGFAPDRRVIVAGWSEVGTPPTALALPDVTTVLVPPRGIGPGRAIEDRRYGYFVAEAPIAQVPALLSPADGLERRRAVEAAGEPRAWEISKYAQSHGTDGP